ncbi:secreted protein [Melampsora americana]|nr:secreted protein [Melampsora americana]
MHLSTVISSLVLACAASPDTVAHLAVRSPSEQEAGCGGMGIPINPALGFAQPMIFNNAPALANFATFGAGLGATVGLWAGASFQIIQQQFTMMIVSMSTLMAPFLSGCGVFCTAAIGPMFLQTVTQIVMQMQALCQIIWTQFPGQIALFGNQFQIMAMFFQTVIGMGLTMGINLNFGGFGAGQFFGGGRVGLVGQLLNPLVTLLLPVTQGLGSLLHNVGLGAGSLLSGGLF